MMSGLKDSYSAASGVAVQRSSMIAIFMNCRAVPRSMVPLEHRTGPARGRPGGVVLHRRYRSESQSPPVHTSTRGPAATVKRAPWEASAQQSGVTRCPARASTPGRSQHPRGGARTVPHATGGQLNFLAGIRLKDSGRSRGTRYVPDCSTGITASYPLGDGSGHNRKIGHDAGALQGPTCGNPATDRKDVASRSTAAAVSA